MHNFLKIKISENALYIEIIPSKKVGGGYIPPAPPVAPCLDDNLTNHVFFVHWEFIEGLGIGRVKEHLHLVRDIKYKRYCKSLD